MQKIEKLGYFNGEWGPLEEMEVPFLDRSSFYGDGVYDATMTQDGVILYEQEHIDRFYRSADLMQITIEQSKKSLHKFFVKWFRIPVHRPTFYIGKLPAEQTLDIIRFLIVPLICGS